ncbi:CatB-related O-acetyltransferase [Paraprevotella xylaniphila]|uniref:xenobiotic acyltransferase family protein n=1 Tax=Paraprevotella xylaniphila TaxID=454155 RepID=UPI0023EF837C|nr:CatB-related O-acetyltransferase [Paraprevotella xylaniphila]
MNKKVLRALYYPMGLLKALFKITNTFSRDFENKKRYRNAIIDSGACLSDTTIIGINAHILENCIINNSQVGNYSYIGRNCLIQNTYIGNYCSIANDVFIGLGKHPLDMFSTSPLFYRKANTFNISIVEDKEFDEYQEIIVGNDVWIGTRSIILDGVKIGNGAVIAAGSVVTKDVEPYMIVAGVPAKPIRKRATEDKIREYQNSKWWNLNPKDSYRMFEQ